MTLPQRKSIMKAFISSYFGYCPLVWMFHSRKLNHRINNIQERALRLVFKDHTSSYQTLLEKDNSVPVHIRNIQVLATELYNVANGISSEIMKEVLPLKESLKYPSQHILQSPNTRTTTYGLNSLTHLGPKIWAILPDDLKKVSSLKVFSQRIKLWNPSNCPCKLCMPNIAGL